MGWYVFALVDEPPSGRPGKGLTGSLALRRIGKLYAIVERRADVPPAEFGTLSRHHDVVTSLSSRVPAILPVRFGTLLDGDALEETLAERGDDLADALDAVRHRVQFTWRLKRPTRASTRSTNAQGSAPITGSTGTDYLRRAARASRPAPPAAWRTLRTRLAPLVAAERYQAVSAAMPESLYHLVARDSVERYTTMGRALAHANPRLTMSGPWPPFAFAPEFG